ncbi:DUF2490 domain-containing protein [Aquimarina brevivitae]|uniref:Uncharacterized protein DUF2490 n=1 Tax=Aquimarina brevivitae TaxID=323412 RepID=A0A4Q7P139_9FLAO|nr:DUF2490 domain-containing protein [Aquimarina brevivitae]RZS93404.1 uncharacterized protein DUF2490 [Aquimarina brevivitae]
MAKQNLLKLTKPSTLLVVVMLCMATTSKAQETGEDQWGAWYMYFGTNAISDKLSIHTEAQFRLYNVGSNFNQLLLRTGLNYHLSEEAMVTGGYAFIATDPTYLEFPGEEDSKEHRIFQQFILKNTVGKMKFEHRYRLEQRFISTQTEDFTAHRARYRLLLTYPITDHWFVSVYDEVFINLQEPIFDQNRLFGAVGYAFTKDLNIQLGYLKNHFSGRNFDRLQLAVFFNTDFRKKE